MEVSTYYNFHQQAPEVHHDVIDHTEGLFQPTCNFSTKADVMGCNSDFTELKSDHTPTGPYCSSEERMILDDDENWGGAIMHPILHDSNHDETNDDDNSIVGYTVIQFSSEDQNIKHWSDIESFITVTHSFLDEDVKNRKEIPSFFTSEQTSEFCKSRKSFTREICTKVPGRLLSHDGSDHDCYNILSFFLNTRGVQFHSQDDVINLDVVLFVQYVPTSQILQPIKIKLPLNTKDYRYDTPLFIGSVGFHNGILLHHKPSECSLIEEKLSQNEPKQFTINNNKNIVISVGREDLILEKHGARSGRPIHRVTGQLLMTKDQVEKVFEIRSRWEGLSPRQRKGNVFDSDFFPFITINRDETAECLGACSTWLKDVIRAQGVYKWPGRPLRKSGACLQIQKELLESAQARLKYVPHSHPEREQYDNEVQIMKQNIANSVQERIIIVQEHVSKEYFRHFIEKNGPQFLNPTWTVLPPVLPYR